MPHDLIYIQLYSPANVCGSFQDMPGKAFRTRFRIPHDRVDPPRVRHQASRRRVRVALEGRSLHLLRYYPFVSRILLHRLFSDTLSRSFRYVGTLTRFGVASSRVPQLRRLLFDKLTKRGTWYDTRVGASDSGFIYCRQSLNYCGHPCCNHRLVGLNLPNQI